MITLIFQVRAKIMQCWNKSLTEKCSSKGRGRKITSVIFFIEGFCKLPGAFFYPGCKTPTLSVYLHRRGVPALWSSLWPLSGLAPVGPYPSNGGDPRAEHSTPDELSQEQSRGAEWPPSAYWVGVDSLRSVVLCWLMFHLLVSVCLCVPMLYLYGKLSIGAMRDKEFW